jgi:tungstate transport system substrate-binding protein
MKKIYLTVLLGSLLILVGASYALSADTLMMATTTSTDNTGLLDILAPEFQKDTGVELKWTAVGTGKALEMGKNCDVDVLLVHAPEAEEKFVEEGAGVNRREVMYNDFIIIGPPNDPAAVKGKTVAEALKTIADKKAVFTSRGDNSGTHKAEQSLWKVSDMAIPDKEEWYIQTGQGMISTINVAAERDGYCMTDRGTFIKYESDHKGEPPLVIVVEGDKTLFNQYSVIEVNPEKCEKVRNDPAKKFSDWMVSKKVQNMIDDFKLMDKKLFTANANK